MSFALKRIFQFILPKTRRYCISNKLERNKDLNIPKYRPEDIHQQGVDGLKDILIYRNKNPTYYKILNLFAIAQFCAWTFVAINLKGLKDVGKRRKMDEIEVEEIQLRPAKDYSDDKWAFWRKFNLTDNKAKDILCFLGLLFGYGTLSVCYFFTVRSVRFLVLLKDKKSVSFVNFTPLPSKNRIITVPIEETSAAGSRNSGKNLIPIKIKGHRFFYIIDSSQGEFVHPEIFDQTVGIERNFAKKKKK